MYFHFCVFVTCIALIHVSRCVHRSDFQIIGGQNADIGEYPWMAEMYYFNLPSCAGTLISEDYVLTAAQCVDGVSPEQIEIVLGLYDIFTQDEGQPETYLVSEITMNPDYVFDSGILNTTIAGDLALLTLSEGANMSNPFIEIVELVPEDSGDFVGDQCTITAWGRMEWIHPNELQEAVVTVHSLDACKFAYSETTYFVRDDMTCAGSDRSTGGCFGDAGAPLLCSVGEALQQVAVLSWIMPPCNVEYPTVMTDIATYREWIQEVTGI